MAGSLYPFANRVDLDETAPAGAVSSGSTLFANVLQCCISLLYGVTGQSIANERCWKLLWYSKTDLVVVFKDLPTSCYATISTYCGLDSQSICTMFLNNDWC